MALQNITLKGSAYNPVMTADDAGYVMTPEGKKLVSTLVVDESVCLFQDGTCAMKILSIEPVV